MAVALPLDALPLETLLFDVPGVPFRTGPLGIVVVFVYSFLVAFVLPLPGEVVLAVPLGLGWSAEAELALVVLVASLGKALGSLAALWLGQNAATAAARSRAVVRLRATVAPGDGSGGRLTRFVQEYGYLGMILVLSIPLMPDTAVVYAFSVVETSYPRFAVAAFVGSALRLLIVLGAAGAVLSLL